MFVPVGDAFVITAFVGFHPTLYYPSPLETRKANLPDGAPGINWAFRPGKHRKNLNEAYIQLLTMVKFGRGINALSFAVVASVGFDAFFDGGFKRSPLSFLSLPDLIR